MACNVKRGKCKYGRSGKKPDQQGKICSYSHPPVCKKHEMFGKCMNNRCGKLHLSLCRMYMNSLNCHYGDKCKFFHPKMVTSVNQSKSSIFTQGQSQQLPTYTHFARKNVQPEMKDGLTPLQYAVENGQVKSDHPTYTQEVKSNAQQKVNSIAQNSFLGLQVQQNTQNPFLELMKSQKEILRRLEQLESQNPCRNW